MIVSIIIPVYNVEKYLSRCIESVIGQTYEHIEIILVNDGSTDHSLEICEKYKIVDKRIKIINKNNGGLSSARNAGIDECSGDYIYFLDSDDYISRDCIEYLVKLMEENNSDISIMPMMYVSEATNSEIAFSGNEKIVILDSEKAIKESLYQRLFTCCAPSKLYKRSVIGDIRFPLGRISEDLATCHLFLDSATSIVYTNRHSYYYRQQNNSIMHIFNPKRLDAIEWAKEIEKFCVSKYPNIMDAAICRTFNVAIHLALDIAQMDSPDIKCKRKIWKEIKRTRIKTMFNHKARMRDRVAAFLSFFGEKILVVIWNSKLAIKREEG